MVLNSELMRDDATGKLMRDDATGKLMRAVEAYDCSCFSPGQTPKDYTLIFSGVVLCPGRSWPGGSNLNREWYLTQYDGETYPCLWRYLDSDWLIYVQFNVGDPAKTWVRAYTPGTFNYYYFTFSSDNPCYTSGEGNSIYTTCVGDVHGRYGKVLLIPGIGQGIQQRRLPTGDSAVQWSPGANNYLLVDDPIGSPDDDGTYTSTDVQTNKDLFSFASFVVPAGRTITNVKAFGRFKRIDAGGAEIIRVLMKVGGTIYVGTMTQLVVGAYFDVTHTWTVNPKTGIAWTVADVNGVGANPLQAFGYECIGFQKTIRCTQSYIEVNYG